MCRPREGGDLSITQDRSALENEPPPSRGRQDKDTYLQNEALLFLCNSKTIIALSIALRDEPCATQPFSAQHNVSHV